MIPLAVHFSLEFRAGLRHRTLLLMNYLMPLGFYFLIGGMMVQLNPYFGEQLVPAMVIFATISGVIMGLPTSLVEARTMDVLRSFRVNGVPSTALLAVPTFSNAVHVGLVALVITVTAPLLFQSPLPVNWPAYLLVFLLLLFASSGLGCLIGVIAANSHVAVLWQQLVFLPSILLGGLMVPAGLMPPVFRKIGHLLPASYAMQAFRGLAFRQESLYQPLFAALTLFAGGLLAFSLALHLFAWDNYDKRRRRHPALAALVLLPYLVGALFLV